MPINPLDSERSWPDRPYGASNFLARPNETRSRESIQKTPTGLRQMEEVIWDATSLYREQIGQALSAREYSPDSVIGLADLITDARTNAKSAKDGIRKLEENREMLLWALRLYDKVPESYKQDPVKGHRSLVQGNWTGAITIQRLEESGFKFEKKYEDGRPDEYATSTIRYAWENAARILRVVARYLDETTRN